MSTGKAIGLLIAAAVLYVFANMVLDDARQYRAEQAIRTALNSPQVQQVQLAQIAETTQALCVAKGYSEDYCKKFLSN